MNEETACWLPGRTGMHFVGGWSLMRRRRKEIEGYAATAICCWNFLSGTAGRFNGRPARDGSRSPRRARTGSAARLGVEERRFDEHRSGATRRTMLSGRGDGHNEEHPRVWLDPVVPAAFLDDRSSFGRPCRAVDRISCACGGTRVEQRTSCCYLVRNVYFISSYGCYRAFYFSFCKSTFLVRNAAGIVFL